MEQDTNDLIFLELLPKYFPCIAASAIFMILAKKNVVFTYAFLAG